MKVSRRPRKQVGILGVTALLGVLVLTGCGTAQVDVAPAAGSPDVEDTTHIFNELHLLGETLVPLNKDESFQLRQQFELEAHEADQVKVESGDPGCKTMLKESFDLPNLHWPSLAAVSPDKKTSAQIFLAPSSKDVNKLVKRIQAQVEACSNATITVRGHAIKVSAKPYTGNKCAAGYAQTVTREGETQSLEVCFTEDRNALLAMAAADRSKPDIAGDMAVFSSDFFTRLNRMYTN